jgi:hypothetical protein
MRLSIEIWQLKKQPPFEGTLNKRMFEKTVLRPAGLDGGGLALGVGKNKAFFNFQTGWKFAS